MVFRLWDTLCRAPIMFTSGQTEREVNHWISFFLYRIAIKLASKIVQAQIFLAVNAIDPRKTSTNIISWMGHTRIARNKNRTSSPHKFLHLCHRGSNKSCFRVTYGLDGKIAFCLVKLPLDLALSQCYSFQISLCVLLTHSGGETISDVSHLFDDLSLFHT